MEKDSVSDVRHLRICYHHDVFVGNIGFLPSINIAQSHKILTRQSVPSIA